MPLIETLQYLFMLLGTLQCKRLLTLLGAAEPLTKRLISQVYLRTICISESTTTCGASLLEDIMHHIPYMLTKASCLSFLMIFLFVCINCNNVNLSFAVYVDFCNLVMKLKRVD